MNETKLRVDVWSDIACPWCYVGKRHLEAALAAFPHASEVDLVWRAFELDPAAPRERDRSQSYAERLASKYGCSVREAEGMIARMTDVARADGIEMRFDRARSGNTFDAHRVLHLAHTHGKQDAMKERLFLAYMTEGESLGDPETLVRLASEVGLDGEDVRAMLASDRFEREVRADEAEAREAGVSGVPFFVFGRKYAVSGAQPAEVLLRGLTLAWEDLAPKRVVLGGSIGDAAEGAACGPEGCT